MEKYYADLASVLDKQLQIYRALSILAQEKQPVLVKGVIPDLERLTKEEELLILKVGRLEEERLALHQALANHFSLSAEELTISELIKRLDGDTGKNLERICADLAAVLKELAELNQSNIELINSSLDFVNFSLDILTSTGKSPVYGIQDDDTDKSVAAKIFDRKI